MSSDEDDYACYGNALDPIDEGELCIIIVIILLYQIIGCFTTNNEIPYSQTRYPENNL